MGQVMTIPPAPFRTISMEKDKRNKAKSKDSPNNIDQNSMRFPDSRRSLLFGLNNDVYPFENLSYSDQFNPFGFSNPKRALTYKNIIESVIGFARISGDPLLWSLGKKKEILSRISELEKQAKQIEKMLKSLIPVESRRIKNDNLLRYYEVVPKGLIDRVEFYKVMMEKYDEKQPEKYRIKGNSSANKLKNIERFWNLHLCKKCPKRLDDTRTYTNIALSILSYFSFCSYTALKSIYHKYPSNARKDIHDEMYEYPLPK